jgi:PhoH-like ATPase
MTVLPSSVVPVHDGDLRPDPIARATTRTIVVLDTSALVADPEALGAFAGVDVVVPLTVIEELDHLKTRPDDVGWAARTVLRRVEELRVAQGGDIRTAVPLPHGGTLRVEPNGLHLSELSEHGLATDRPDNRILAAALGQALHGPVTLVSNDAALRIKAAQLGLAAEEHRLGGTDDDLHVGWHAIEVSHVLIDRLYGERLPVGLDDVDAGDAAALGVVADNEFVVLRCGRQSGLARLRDGALHLPRVTQEAWGLSGRSKEQRFALELLLDPTVSVVALDGPAGTGKTILAMAAALEQVVEPARRRYAKLSIFRPIVPVGKAELGFLPGDLDEKLAPWMAAITDTVVALSSSRTDEEARTLIDEMRQRGQLTMESVAFLRGRTLVNTFVLVDEAQNLEPPTLKTILTRVGEGSKIVFTGDTSQVDNPYTTSRSNALTVLTDRFRGQRTFGHVRLSACERSEVAALAADLLDGPGGGPVRRPPGRG